MRGGSSRYAVVDIFCGAGGFARGFRDEGFSIIFGVDSARAPARTFKENFPEAVVLAEDVKEIDGELVVTLTGKTPDVIIGSPPCEPFTPANPKRMEKPIDRLYVDPIGRLVLHFIRIIGELRPRIWIMENVPGLLEGELREALRREFGRVGYREIYFHVLRAEDFCTPSKRTRVFVSNVRLTPSMCERAISVEEALRGLPPPGPEPPNHEPSPISSRKLRRIRALRRGEAMIYYEGHGGRKLPNFTRLRPNEPAPPVLGSSRFVHPHEDRLLTVREQARLMGYPDDHVFLGGRDEQYNMVGESVPPTLSRALARSVLEQLEKGGGE
ncbi:MAG: DNA cytosine methyltransferase [Fervidicoccaceae archaeon]